MAVLQETELLGPSSGFGLAPVGAVVPFASNLTGSYSIPTSGDVNNEGWMLCDGSSIPDGNTLTGTLPDLTDTLFLRGNTTSNAGTTGGSASVTLGVTNIPSHTHTGNIGQYCHNHGVSDPTHRHCLLGRYTQIGGGATFEPGYVNNRCFFSCYSGVGIGIQNRCLSLSYTTDSCGSGSAFSIVPKFLDVVYLVRVK